MTAATPATVTEMDYLYDANYKARNINGLVTETRVKDASGNVKAKSQITYDGLSLLDESYFWCLACDLYQKEKL